MKIDPLGKLLSKIATVAMAFFAIFCFGGYCDSVAVNPIPSQILLVDGLLLLVFASVFGGIAYLTELQE